MTKISKKLLVFFSVLVCSLCLGLGITACSNGGEHTHTFGGFWLFDGADGHYRLATCHPEVKSELSPHVDKNNDFNCDVCGYLMHVHVDGDGDFKCDECQAVIHKHTYKEKWSFNENNHWHDADCEHFIERSDYADHRFIEGVCPCGVKKSEVKVYELYKNSPEYNLYFVQWLAWLKAEGITVEYTESGDGIYHYENGTDEVRFLGERTVKVKAQSGSEPLSDVWFMVTLFTDNEYYQTNGTIALGIAKTDESGIAEIAFNPVGGYSSGTVQYRIRVALAADVAIALGIDEESAKPVPNRYTVNNTSEYFLYEVSEYSGAEDIAATVDFTFSKGWNAYDTIELPYKRFYQDQINGTGIKEEGTTYELTASGENLFDYFIFEPSKYSFKDSGSLEDSAKIEENAKQAASGIYKISFAVEGNANATLYYWNENGVNMGAYHATKPDGTPSDDYITSISGGTAGNGKYTGGNFVNVTVIPADGLRQYQFGIISDASVKITFTVERTGDYVEQQTPNTVLGVGEENSIETNFTGYSSKSVTLKNITDGLYAVSVIPDDSSISKGAGNIVAYTDSTNRSMLWENNKYKGVIRLLSTDKKLTVSNEGFGFKGKIMLEPYELPVLESDISTYVPVSNASGAEYNIPLGETVTEGQYRIDITLDGSLAAGKMYTVTVVVGGKSYTIKTNFVSASVTYSEFIQIPAGTQTIKLISSTTSYNTLTANVKLSAQHGVVVGVPNNVDYNTTKKSDNEKLYSFTAPKAGTYRITLTLLSEENINKDLYYMRVENAYNSTQIIIPNGQRVDGQVVTTSSGTFEMQQGAEIVLKFTRTLTSAIMNFDFVIEFVEN
ncbi:MAG: hypothetical protein J1F61_06095 [Clostridiales bacterium]|nr:hypothetical protein [Clostridiales bacterium]